VYDPQNEFEERYANYPAAAVEDIRNDVTLGALKGAAVRLGGMREGRKTIIFVSEGFISALPAQLNALGKAMGVTIYGISGYRTPAHSLAVGGFADDPHTKGEAEDIGVNSLLRSSAAQISEAELAQFGLYRPFDPSDDPNNTEVNHIQLIPKAGPLTLVQATDTFNADPSCS